jgi:hypothetical protein
MFIKLFAYAFVALAFEASARDTLVSATAPYSSGVVRLGADSGAIVFSNGVTVSSFQFNQPNSVPEYTMVDVAISLRFTAGTVVYRKPQSPLASGAPNPDTAWASAALVPAAVYPPDSLFFRDSASGRSSCNMKILCSRHYPDELYCGVVSPHYDYRSILYFLPSPGGGPSMKLQVVSIVMDSVNKSSPSGVCRDPKVSAIVLRWAVDSLGNGLFLPPVGVRTARCKLLPGASLSGGRARMVATLDNARCMNAKGNGSSTKGPVKLVSLKGAHASETSGNAWYIHY